MTGSRPDLDARLLTSWVRRLLSDWQHYNWEYASEALRPPSIRIDDATARLGAYDHDLRLLSISAAHILRDPWPEVQETLRHEMAHQYAFEVYRATDEPPHGPAFRRACRVLRVSDRAAASCDERRADDARGDATLLARVSKLLALGQSTNENEAEAAMRKARELLAQHDIDPERSATPEPFQMRQLGPLKQRHQAFEHRLAGILTRFFHVEAIWVGGYDAARDRAGSILEVHGTPTHLQLAEYVHAYLWHLLPDLWDRYKRARGLRGDADRRSYYAGVLQGFQRRLEDQERRAPQAQAIVLTRRNPRLDSWFRHIHPRIRQVGGGRTRWSEAYGHGVEEGRSISLRQPIGDRGDQGRMLGDPHGAG